MKIVILLTWFCFLYVCFRKLNLLKADFSKDDNNGEGQDNSDGSCSIPEVHILNQVKRVHQKPCLVSHLAPDFLLWQQHAFNVGCSSFVLEQEVLKDQDDIKN